MCNEQKVMKATSEDNIEKPFGICDSAFMLCQDDWGNQLWVFKESDRTTSRYGFQIVTNKQVVGEPIFRKKEQLMGKTGFRFMFSLAADFSYDDTMKARQKFFECQDKMDALEINDKCSMNKMYQNLCIYVKEHEQESDEITIDTVTDEDTGNGSTGQRRYANIPTKRVFDRVISDCDVGWKPLEVKRMLKRLGLLRVTEGRPYDYAKYRGSEQYRVISFLLEDSACA